jgi:hypothetical protein
MTRSTRPAPAILTLGRCILAGTRRTDDAQTPPTYAWDWLARQRLLWREMRDRLPGGSRVLSGEREPSRPRVSDVPDWAPDVGLRPAPVAVATAGRDYRDLDTRAEVIAALRADYPTDDEVRAVVDTVVRQFAFLDRTAIPLDRLGVGSAPRGMRWWWAHLGGTGIDRLPSTSTRRPEQLAELPVQLRLVDVQAGYGDRIEDDGDGTDRDDRTHP